MKKIFLWAVLALMSVTVQAQDAEYIISGTAPISANWVYYFFNDAYRGVDSVEVKQGSFQIKGTKPLNTFITVTDKHNHYLTIINDRTPITINLNDYSIVGSSQNVEFGNFQKKQKKQTDEIIEIYNKYKELAADTTTEGETKKVALKKQIEQIQAEQVKDVIKFAQANKNSVAPAYYLNDYFYSLSYNDLVSALDKNSAYYNHPIMKNAKRQLSSLEKRRPGLQYTDLVMKDSNGKTAKLSNWIGKGNYVLVDFWASWCGPCRMEMPHVVNAYKRYHTTKGFDVVGVSFDSKAESWKKGIQDLDMPWHNISDLQGWKCAAAEVYGITSIPSNILIDPSGKIIACDLRGENLANKLKEIYGY